MRTALLAVIAGAFGLGAALADEWPCYAHDPAHTSFSNEPISPDLVIAWDKEIGRSTAQPVVAGGRVYIGTWGGRLFCLNADTGDELWHFDAKGKIGFAAAVNSNIVVFGSDDKTVYALDAQSGKLVWRKETGDKIWSAPAIVDGVVFIGSNDFNLYALDLKTGEEKWKADCGSQVWSSPAVAGGIVYAAAREGMLFAFDKATGKQLWSHKTQGKIAYSSPSVADGVVCIGTLLGRVWDDGTGYEWFIHENLAKALVEQGKGITFYALDAKTGEELWSWPREAKPPQEMEWGGNRSWFRKLYSIAQFQGLAPSIADGVVYAHCTIYNHEHNAPVLAFDLKTGKLLWDEEFTRAWTGGHLIKNNVALTQDFIFGTSFIGRRDGTILELSRRHPWPWGECPDAGKLTGGAKGFHVYSPVVAEGKVFANGIIRAIPAMSHGGDNLRAFKPREAKR
ncbi:MAG TPA: PQQ-binding-like beta-propeller repeat protein [Planctomycetota bacterium]|nr:PQQ-binding-like beta-propeller repeat protein [Planctomycetota bacterium]HRR80663.1 PQQ-binding-like beta-propeller repeat protein [Planctomycetota bacterium]HRT93251.1 PQQ-binding-like beta-propeller repeat protein [Planctomycetota bacterium]